MSQDEVTTEEVVEQTEGSEETQNSGEEDNSLGESKKNQSNFKKLAKRYKEERKERERLQAELKKFQSVDKDEDEDFGIEDDEETTDEAFSDVKSEIWFMKNKEAEQYREKMAEMVDDNPLYGKLSLKDLYELAQARYKKSVSKTNFDVSSGKSGGKAGSIDFSQMSEEQIEKLNPAQSKLFLEWMKKQK